MISKADARARTRSNEKRRRNHWVPQAYLRYFAADEARRKIWTFSKTEGEPELKPIEKVAVKHYLYAPQDADGARDYSFEHQLSEVEQWLGNPCWKAAATGFIDLSDEMLRKMFALTMAITYLRNPAQLEVSRHIHRQMAAFIAKAGSAPTHVEHRGVTYALDPASWPAFRDATEEDIKRNWLDSARDATSLAKIFLDMRWSMVIADEPLFITSDNPVTPIHKDLRFRGFSNSGTSVMFPLSPTRILSLDHLKSEPDSQYYRAPGRGEALNLLIWRNAIDKMYASRDIYDVIGDLDADAKRLGY